MNDRDIEDTREPQDRGEAILCDECGEVMECEDWEFPRYPSGYYKLDRETALCTNSFCPAKHEGINKEMAEKIVELLYDNHILTGKNKYLLWREKTLVEHLKMILNEDRERIIDSVSK